MMNRSVKRKENGDLAGLPRIAMQAKAHHSNNAFAMETETLADNECSQIRRTLTARSPARNTRLAAIHHLVP